LSAERVRAELLKVLAARHGVEVLVRADAAGLVAPLLGGIARPARLARLTEIERAREAPADPLLRLAGLAVAVREDAERLRERLRLSNAESERLAGGARALEAWHGLDAPPAPGELRAALFERGRLAAMDGLTLAAAEARASGNDSRWHAAWRFLRDTPAPRLPFTGADLVAKGLSPGRGVGAALKALQAKWIRAGFPREPETLARLLAEALAEL
jgi:poly(A) polymerase